QEEFCEQCPVSCRCQVAVNGMEHPEGPINGVVLRCLTTVRETVGNEPPVGIGGKGFEETSCLGIPPRAEKQSWQRNHAVPSPVGEPGIAGDDCFTIRRARPLPAI